MKQRIYDIAPYLGLAVLLAGGAYALFCLWLHERRRAARLRRFAKEYGLKMEGHEISGIIEGTSVSIRPGAIKIRDEGEGGDLVSPTTRVSVPLEAPDFWICKREDLPNLVSPLPQLQEEVVLPDPEFSSRFVARAAGPLKSPGWEEAWVRHKIMGLGLAQAVCKGGVLIVQFRRLTFPAHVHRAVLCTIGLTSAARAADLAPKANLPIPGEPPVPAGFWAMVPAVLFGAIGSSSGLLYNDEWKSFVVSAGIGYVTGLFVFGVIVSILKRRLARPARQAGY